MKMKAIFNNGALLAVALSVGACKAKSASSEPADAAARRALLETLGKEVIAKTYAEFEERAQALDEALARYADGLAEADRAAAQAAFKDAMLTWQRAELFQVGPAARVSSMTPGGKGLRNEIYNWPSQNLCGAASLLLDADGSGTYADRSALAQQFQDVRGLDTLERLLFDDGEESRCTKKTVVDPAQWQALVDSGELAQRRASYARTIASLVRERATTLVGDFDAFLPELTSAGQGSKLFATAHEGLNALTDGIFYLAEDTKDIKLAGPAAVLADCGSGCAELAELRFAGISRDAVVANIEAFIDLYRHGDDGPTSSLKGLLVSVSASALAEEIDTLASAALADAKAITPSLEEAAASGDPSLTKAYQSVQELSSRLKNEFITTLSLSVPANAASDND
jgi:uncharacterized protein